MDSNEIKDTATQFARTFITVVGYAAGTVADAAQSVVNSSRERIAHFR